MLKVWKASRKKHSLTRSNADGLADSTQGGGWGGGGWVKWGGGVSMNIYEVKTHLDLKWEGRGGG